MKRWLIAWLCAGLASHALARPIDVRFPSLDRDAAGAAVSLQGMLLLPRSAMPPGGYPAVIALHGCGGMYSIRDGHEQELAERMALRAQMYLREGYAVLFADSFRARGMREICTIKHGERTVTAAQRRLDALGALGYLAARPDIARDRIALVGWSHGGSAALQAVNTRDAAVAGFFERPGAPPFFRAAVALYPGCVTPLKAGDRYAPGAPTRVHIGLLDDWTPAATCAELGNAMASSRRGSAGDDLSRQLSCIRLAHRNRRCPDRRAQRRQSGPRRPCGSESCCARRRECERPCVPAAAPGA